MKQGTRMAQVALWLESGSGSCFKLSPGIDYLFLKRFLGRSLLSQCSSWHYSVPWIHHIVQFMPKFRPRRSKAKVGRWRWMPTYLRWLRQTTWLGGSGISRVSTGWLEGIVVASIPPSCRKWHWSNLIDYSCKVTHGYCTNGITSKKDLRRNWRWHQQIMLRDHVPSLRAFMLARWIFRNYIH